MALHIPTSKKTIMTFIRLNGLTSTPWPDDFIYLANIVAKQDPVPPKVVVLRDRLI